MKKIMRNRVMCYRCLETIESVHVHDYVTCKCESVAVDGGREYLKRCGDPEGYQELSLLVPEDVYARYTKRFPNSERMNFQHAELNNVVDFLEGKWDW